MKRNIKYYTYKKLRDRHYREENIRMKKDGGGGTDLDNWYVQPYSFLKAIFYIECGVLLVYTLQYTRITPNFLTVVYIILGFLGGILLSIDNSKLILVGTIIFFSKSILDWSDGLLARIKKKTSELGAMLDSWGGVVGEYSFITGIGFYLFNKYQNVYFLFLIILILILKFLDFKSHYYIMSVFTLLNKDKKQIKSEKSKKILKFHSSKALMNIKFFISNLFDGRSRSVDFICLMILIDTFYIEVFFIKYIFYFITLKTVILFLGSFYMFYFKSFGKNIKIL